MAPAGDDQQGSAAGSHVFVNEAGVPLTLSWGDEGGHHETPQPEALQPGGRVTVGTLRLHTWRARTPSGRLLASFSGPSSEVTLGPEGIAHLQPLGAGAAAGAPEPGAGAAHEFVNDTDEQLTVSYGDDYHDTPYDSPLPAHGRLVVGSLDSHVWRIRSPRRGLVARVQGPSSTVTITPQGFSTEPRPQGAGAAPAAAPGPPASSSAADAAQAAPADGAAAGAASESHLFVNETGEELSLTWGDGQFHETAYALPVPPHGRLTVGTLPLHTWRVRSPSRGVVATVSGPSATVTITAEGATTQRAGAGAGAGPASPGAPASTAPPAPAGGHLFVNETGEALALTWGDGQFHETAYDAPLPPFGRLTVGTLPLHTWRVKSPSGALLASVSGESAVVTITPGGATISRPGEGQAHSSAAARGPSSGAAEAQPPAAGAADAAAEAPGGKGTEAAKAKAKAGAGGTTIHLSASAAGAGTAAASAGPGGASAAGPSSSSSSAAPAPGANSAHLFVNNTDEQLSVSYGDAHHDTPYGQTVPPYGSLLVGTLPLHTWRVRSPSGALLASVSGASSVVTLQPAPAEPLIERRDPCAAAPGPGPGPAAAPGDAAHAAAAGAAGAGAAGRAGFHVFVNATPRPLHLSWGSELTETPQPPPLEPGARVTVGTYPLHMWRARSPSRRVLATYSGPSAIITVTPEGATTEPAGAAPPPPQPPHAPPPPPGAPPAGDAAPGPSGSSSATGAAGPPAAAAAPLKAAGRGATLTKDLHTMEWNGQVSENSFHLFVNDTDQPLALSWGDEGHHDAPYGDIAPRANLFVGTYNFHTWRVRSATRGLVASVTGPSAVVTITPAGFRVERNTTQHAPGGAAGGAAGGGEGAGGADGAGAGAGGEYRQRGEVLGMPIWAFDCVPDAAVSRLGSVAGSMLAASPPALVQRLAGAGAAFAVFGAEQVVSDVPAHRFMRYNTGRDLDTSARGLGATPAIPVTSCGEENLTMQGDRWYPCQSILVHEMGHAVHNMGLSGEQVAAVLEAYRAAMEEKLYPPGCYMAVNEQEYWAVACESWFESTIRADVNGGVKTRKQLKKHDPRLAALLAEAFGDGPWRYHHDCPRPLTMPTAADAAAAAAVAASRAAAAAAAAGSNGSAAAAGSGGAAGSELVPPLPAAGPGWRTRRPTRLSVGGGGGTFAAGSGGRGDGSEDEGGAPPPPASATSASIPVPMPVPLPPPPPPEAEPEQPQPPPVAPAPDASAAAAAAAAAAASASLGPELPPPPPPPELGSPAAKRALQRARRSLEGAGGGGGGGGGGAWL
ncbi:hypothetical protein HYH03_017208 [Edaphochlamys debaryana]|uniref:von Hippel-Lindau disease tumour suppressor beta domain-containing protein n=1 Tax=Edaphochlamys debaryana TaxID=47281 RepID=A0A835XH33_9CHLO|nr:hypothetical protein HYH03_017208 [Edaphochlamys debaryana]|eukprot:KAG2483963.1 hypothetical protein HYH03_017208 [Edaphochlamys debaryana]